MGHIMLEPTVEIDMTEEDSDDVPDLELFEPSVEINTDEKAEPEKIQEHMDLNEMFILENLNFLLENLNSDEVIEEHQPLLIKTFVKVKKKRRRPA